MGIDWTTDEPRHSFVSLVSDQLGDLVKVATSPVTSAPALPSRYAGGRRRSSSFARVR